MNTLQENQKGHRVIYTNEEVSFMRASTTEKLEILRFRGQKAFQKIFAEKLGPYPLLSLSSRGKNKLWKKCALELLYEKLYYPSNCFKRTDLLRPLFDNILQTRDKSELERLTEMWLGDIKPFTHIIIDDDDKISSIAGKLAGDMIEKKHGIKPTYIVSGELGMLSSHTINKSDLGRETSKKSEALMHKHVLMSLGVSEAMIDVIVGGKDTGKIVMAIDQYVRPNMKVLYVLKQRSSIRAYLTVKKQAKNFDVERLTIEESFDFVPKTWNFKNLYGNESFYQEIPLNLERHIEYEGVFITQLDEEFWNILEKNPEIAYAYCVVNKSYKIRVNRKASKLSEMYKYARMFIQAKFQKKKAQREFEEIIKKFS